MAGATTATFLMTDIEGSTRLWEEHSDAMAVALARHDETLKAIVEAQGGRVVKTTGDGLLATFDDPGRAAQSAIDAQRASATTLDGPEGNLRIRMALHTGTAQERDGDVFGPALNRVARLLAIGHGGQVLVSGATAALAEGHLPADAELIDRGDHRLKDLESPEHVYQLIAPELARDFPALRSMTGGQTNLPRQLTSFVGREREMGEIAALLREKRLITLIGTGGTGKTRLMLETAAGVVDAHPDGVWLIELAPVTDPSLIAVELTRTLGLRDAPEAKPIDTVLDYLRYKDLLIALDNCEHLIGAVATLAEEVLEECAEVSIAATSREGLGIPGETIYQVPSLVEASAIELFTERAAAVLPSFRVQPGSADEQAVTEICRRLDGIPLAIELAASRVTVLSPIEILGRLGDRFRLLTGGRRTAMPRQQTLQALIDWSWDLLEPADQRRLAGLSAFAGGWTLEAATAIDDDPAGTLDGLMRLVERSLVVVDRTAGTRYRFLETIRQYAADRLVESGRSDEIRGRHLAYYVEMSERAGVDMRNQRVLEWIPIVDADVDNVRTAIEWGHEADPEASARICIALWELWRARALGAEPGVELLTVTAERLKSLPPIDPPDPGRERERTIRYATILGYASLVRATWTNDDARQSAEESLALARATDDDEAIIAGLSALVLARVFSGDDTGIQVLSEEAAERALRIGDWFTLSQIEASVAMYGVGIRSKEAVGLFEAAITHARLTENPFAVAFITLTRGQMSAALGDPEGARPFLEEAERTYRDLGDERLALIARSELGHALRMVGRYDEAEAIYRETILGWERTGNRGGIAHQLEAFAYIAIGRAQEDRAATLLGAAEAIREASGARMLPMEKPNHDQELAGFEAFADPAVVATGWAAGRTMDTASAIAYALGDQASSTG